MKSLFHKVLTVVSVLALSSPALAFNGKPDPNGLMTGRITCEALDQPNLLVEYTATNGKGHMSVIDQEVLVFEREIFLIRGSRCSAYSGKCFFVLNDAARKGDQLQYFVEPTGEVYNTTDFFNLSFKDGETATISDTEEFPSKIHLSVGFDGAPAPLNQPGKFKMVCSGQAVRSL